MVGCLTKIFKEQLMKYKVDFTEHDSWSGKSALPSVAYNTYVEAQAAIDRCKELLCEKEVPDYYITCSNIYEVDK